MTTTKSECGRYGYSIRKTLDKTFELYTLFNLKHPTHFGSNSDVSERRVYKTEKMAIKKGNQYIELQTA